MSDDAAQRLAALRAKRSEGGTESALVAPQEATASPDAPRTAQLRPERQSGAAGTTRARIVVGSISGVGFVAAAAAMGPILVNPSGGVVEATGPVDSALKVDDTTEVGASAELRAPEVEVVPNYIYVDANGNPLSEAEVAALRTEPIQLASQPTAGDTAALAPEPDAAGDTLPVANAPTSTNAPAVAVPKAATPAATAPPAAPVATAPPATQSPAPATPATTAAPTPDATAAPAPTAAPVTTAAPTTAAPAPTTAAPPPPTTVPPPPPTTAPPKSGSSG